LKSLDLTYLEREAENAGITLRAYREVTSTNDLFLADTDADVIVASGQTAGRGTRGRGYVCPTGYGVYFSVRLRKANASPDFLRAVTPMCGVSLAAAVREKTGKNARLKWINDLYLSGKKIAGILCEYNGTDIICGVGLNLFLSEETARVPGAGGLFSDGETPPEHTAEDIVLGAVRGILRGADSPEKCIDTYRELLLPEYRQYAVLRLNPDFTLTVRDSDGRELTLDSPV
jgi:biotin-[acetyl-CoA-carboxylase] ligase BirA-like protein